MSDASKGGPIRRGASKLAVRLPIIAASLSALAFVFAMVVPFVRMEPHFGDQWLEEILEILFGQSFDPDEYTVVGGILRLYREGDWIIATVLLLFSVLFPAAKLILLFRIHLRPSRIPDKHVACLKWLGPWSMVDVLVVSVTVLAFKSFPGGSRVTVATGYYCFLVSVILGMVANTLTTPKPSSV